MKSKVFTMIVLTVALIIFTTNAHSWTTTQRLTWTSDSSHMPEMAIDSNNNIHVVWQDLTPGNWEIYYKNSTDGGNTWSWAKRLTWTSANSGRPAIAVDSFNNIHIVFQDYTYGNAEILYKKSTDGGQTWTWAKRLTWSPGASKWAKIAIDSANNIHVVWHDDTYGGDWEILYKKSTDGGVTWTDGKRLTFTPGSSYRPVIAIDSANNIHVVWHDASPGNREIYHMKSTDGGTTWTLPQRLTWTSGASYDPAMAIDSNDNIYIVWYDDTPGSWEVYYKKSTDGGATWTWAERITFSSGNSYRPTIATDSANNIHVVWFDDSSGNYDIYYKNSTDGGATWSDGQKLTSWSNNQRPMIAIDSGNVKHVVWEANAQDGNLEIFYKKD